MEKKDNSTTSHEDALFLIFMPSYTGISKYPLIRHNTCYAKIFFLLFFFFVQSEIAVFSWFFLTLTKFSIFRYFNQIDPLGGMIWISEYIWKVVFSFDWSICIFYSEQMFEEILRIKKNEYVINVNPYMYIFKYHEIVKVNQTENNTYFWLEVEKTLMTVVS